MDMETISVCILTLCEGHPLVTGGFLSKMVSDMEFLTFFYISLDKLLNKQPRGRWIEMSWCYLDVSVMTQLCRWGTDTVSRLLIAEFHSIPKWIHKCKGIVLVMTDHKKTVLTSLSPCWYCNMNVIFWTHHAAILPADIQSFSIIQG